MQGKISQDNVLQEAGMAWQKDQMFILLLLFGIVLVYGQTLVFSFVSWDDPEYIMGGAVRGGVDVYGY